MPTDRCSRHTGDRQHADETGLQTRGNIKLQSMAYATVTLSAFALSGSLIILSFIQKKRSSVIADEPRDALRELKSCQLLHSHTKTII